MVSIGCKQETPGDGEFMAVDAYGQAKVYKRWSDRRGLEFALKVGI
jgi:hypothetical protein